MEAGVAVWAVAAGLGLSVLLIASEFAYQVLRVTGVAVLIWFGVKALLGKAKAEVPVSDGSGFRAGLVVNLANPKLAIFAISFLPQFVDPGAPRWVLLALAGLWVMIDTLWYLLFVAMLTPRHAVAAPHRDPDSPGTALRCGPYRARDQAGARILSQASERHGRSGSAAKAAKLLPADNSSVRPASRYVRIRWAWAGVAVSPISRNGIDSRQKATWLSRL
jgi:hypothetical protein